MPLAGLTDAVLADPALREAMADAGSAGVRTLDLTGPMALRPFAVAGLVKAGRPVLAVTATSREAEDLVAELADLVDPTTVGYYPSWETLPHERLSPRSDTVGRRLAVLRRLRHPGSDAANGPLSVVVAPVRSILQPQVKGLGDLDPVELERGPPGRARRRRTPAVRRGVHARRPGREARRVRGPRRHRRRVPADRGAPAAGGVLGRRRRGDPLVRGRRPAHARQARPAVGAAVSRAAAHRRRTPTGRRARCRAPPAARADRQDRRRHRGGGDGVAGAGAGRRDGAARRPDAHPTRRCWCSTPSGRGRVPTTWWPPARSSSAPAGRPRPAAAPPRSTSARRRTASSATSAPTPSTGTTPGGR